MKDALFNSPYCLLSRPDRFQKLVSSKKSGILTQKYKLFHLIFAT